MTMRPVPHYCYFVYLSLAFLLVFPHLANAEDFTVRNIHTEATGQTATEARQRAMSEAEKKGFQKLIARLSDEKTANQLLETKKHAISLMVQGVELNNEKISSTSYAADVTLSFSPDQIRTLLPSDSNPVSTNNSTIPPTTLILPIFTQDGRTTLLDRNNPWWHAWNSTEINNKDVKFVLPLGDLEDISLASLSAARSGDYSRLQRMAEKYHANRIVVADATYGQDIDTKTPVMNVVVYNVKPEGTLSNTLEFKRTAEDSSTTLLAKAVTGLVTGLNSNWKNQGQLLNAALQKTLIKTPFTNLREWQTIQQRLKSVSTVQRTSVERLSGRYAIVALYSASKEEELPAHLQRGGFAYYPSEGIPVIQLSNPAVQGFAP